MGGGDPRPLFSCVRLGGGPRRPHPKTGAQASTDGFAVPAVPPFQPSAPGACPTLATIVGVVENIRNSGPDRPPQPEVYWTFTQGGTWSSFPLAVRVTGDPHRAARPVADAIRSVDPTAAVGEVRTMDEVIGSSVGRPRFYLVLMAVFAGVALVLALAGLYGVTSYLVEQRRRELGIRAALGGSPGRTLGLVLGQGAGLLALGTAAGLAGGFALTRLLQGLLYGVSPLDAVTWLAAPLGLATAAAAALLVPAFRAATLDPVEAIRTE